MEKKAKEEIVVQVKQLIKKISPKVNEKEMYGGLVYERVPKELACGIFVYTNHVSIEFSRGAELKDEKKLLVGKGKKRRHLVLHNLEDIEKQEVATYISRAFKLKSI